HAAGSVERLRSRMTRREWLWVLGTGCWACLLPACTRGVFRPPAAVRPTGAEVRTVRETTYPDDLEAAVAPDYPVGTPKGRATGTAGDGGSSYHVRPAPTAVPNPV